MYCLHHLNESRSQRIVWLFTLLGLEYEIKIYFRNPADSSAPDSLKKIHPLGTAPILTHEGKVLAESGAICEYVVLSAGDTTLIPSRDSKDYIDVQFWSHFSEGSFLPPMVASLVLNKGRERARPFFIKTIVSKFVDMVINAYFGKVIARNLAFVEQHLHNRSWLVGNTITVADIQMSFPLEAMYKLGQLEEYPNTTAYVERFQHEPTYQEAMIKMRKAEYEAR